MAGNGGHCSIPDLALRPEGCSLGMGSPANTVGSLSRVPTLSVKKNPIRKDGVFSFLIDFNTFKPIEVMLKTMFKTFLLRLNVNQKYYITYQKANITLYNRIKLLHKATTIA